MGPLRACVPRDPEFDTRGPTRLLCLVPIAFESLILDTGLRLKRPQCILVAQPSHDGDPGQLGGTISAELSKMDDSGSAVDGASSGDRRAPVTLTHRAAA